MKNAKNIVIFIVSLLLLFSVFNFSFARAGLDFEDLDIAVKGQFQYRFEKYDETAHMIMTLTIVVENKTVITEINDEYFEVIPVDMNGEIELFQYFNLSLVSLEFVEDSGTLNGVIYIPKEGNIGKNEFSMQFQLLEKTNDLTFDFTGNSVTVAETIYDDEPENIEVGSNWTEIVKSEGKETNIMKLIGTSYTTTDTEWENKTEIKEYECIGEETVTVPAGTFETYVIKETIVGENNYSLKYCDKETKIFVKQVEYNNTDIPTNSEMVLISYDFSLSTSSDNDKPNNGVPGFEILLMILAVITIMVWKRKTH